MHAVARVLLDGVIHNIQVSWVKMGVEACQTMLNGGANDFGGTLMEETISRMAGAEWGIRMEPSEIRTAITSIGRTPVERSTTYEPLQRNVNERDVLASMAPLGAAIGERTASDDRFRQGD
jgi:FO synthase